MHKIKLGLNDLISKSNNTKFFKNNLYKFKSNFDFDFKNKESNSAFNIYLVVEFYSGV
jgi:hypothetical protein